MRRSARTYCLVLLAAAMLACGPRVWAQEAPGADGLLAAWSFEPAGEQRTVEAVGGLPAHIRSPFHAVEWIDGPRGRALRLDGYSNWLAQDLAVGLQPDDGLTAQAWVALEAYPVSNAPIVTQHRFPDAGFSFGLNRWGQWYLTVDVAGTWYTAWADEALPTYEWVHVAGTYDRAGGGLTLYLNGEVAGRQATPAAPLVPDSLSAVALARDPYTPTIGPFETGLLGGAIDEVELYGRALSQAEIRRAVQAADPPEAPDLTVPASRFADGKHRPGYHALPPAHWTNEPHGLVYWNGAYHLFHQKNPNGPYFAQIHWGHMTSPDLVHWEHLPIALAPEPGPDRFGTWSGDAVVDDGQLKLLYTGGGGRLGNINLAVAADDHGRTFTKHADNPVIAGPPEGSDAFRDPYLWQEGDVWHMIVGSDYRGETGSAVHYTSSDLVDWTYVGRLYTDETHSSGVFWEMPVFVPLGDDKYVLEVTTVERGAPARGLYWIGTYDGRHFTPDDPEPEPLDLFNHLLSPAVVEDDEGRVVTIAIVPDLLPGERNLEMGWAHLYSLPRLWSLCDDGSLCQRPLPELAELRGAHQHYADVPVEPGTDGHLARSEGLQLEIIAELQAGDARQFGLELRRAPGGRETSRLYYDRDTQTLNLDLSASTLGTAGFTPARQSTPYSLGEDEAIKLHVFLDHSVVEVFVDDREAFSTRVFPTLERSTGIDLFAQGGTAAARVVDVWQVEDVRSIQSQTSQ